MDRSDLQKHGAARCGGMRGGGGNQGEIKQTRKIFQNLYGNAPPMQVTLIKWSAER